MGQTMLAPLREMEPPLPLSPPCSVPVAAGVDLVETDQGGAVWLHGMVTFTWDADDEVGRRLAAVGLVETGAARQRQVAAAFGVNETTVWRWRADRDRAGVAGLVGRPKGPRGPWKVTEQVADRVVALHREGLSGRAIAGQVGVSNSTVGLVLADRGRNTSGESGGDPAGDVDGHDDEGGHDDGEGGGHDDDVDGGGQLELLARPAPRVGERQAARAGLLAGAPPRVCEGGQLPAAGALLALPGLEATGVLDAFAATFADQDDRPAFYDIRALVLTIALGCLLGEPRAQGLTRLDPTMLGRLIGLDRAPEVKTLRRRIGALAALGRSDRLSQDLARRHLAANPDQAGMFYVDGHVRAYHGKHRLPKAHVARMRISMPAEVDTWIGDARGDGILVWTSPPGASLVGELARATTDIRTLVGPDARPTVVFDRGGWSPKLFAQLDATGFDILTYRKNPPRPEPAAAFTDHTVVDDRGIEHTWQLADRTVRIYYGPKGHRRYFECRQITRLCESGHQTAIITTRTDLAAATLAQAMFNRWRQENFFRYMRARFALDSLDSHTVVDDDLDRTVPNPAKKDHARRIRELKTVIASGQATLGRHADNPALADSRAELAATLDEVAGQLADLQAAGRDIPARVPLGDIRPDAARHDAEHKRLVDAIRMATYNAESALARQLAPHYRRAHHEARSLLHEAFATPADIRIDHGQIHVTLNPLSAPRRTRAIAGLCDTLTATQTRYPGTDLTLIYTIKTPTDLA